MDDINIASVNDKVPEDWATEITLRKILKSLEASGRITSANSNSINQMASNGADTNSRLDALIASAKDEKDKINRTEKIKSAKENLSKNERTAFKESTGVSKGNNLINDFADTLPVLGDIVKSLNTAFSTLLNTLMSTSQQYNALYTAGVVSSEESKQAMINGAKEMGISTSQLVEQLKQYPSALNRFGITPIMQSANELRGKFIALGMTSSQTNAFNIAQFEMQRLMFNSDYFKQRRNASMMDETFEITRRFATVLGISVEEMTALQLANAKDIDMKIASLHVNEQSKESFNSMVTFLKKAGLEDVAHGLTGSLAGLNDAAGMASPAFRELWSKAGPEAARVIAEVSADFRAGRITNAEQEEATQRKILNALMANEERAAAINIAGEKNQLASFALAKEQAANMDNTNKDMKVASQGLVGEVGSLTDRWHSMMENLLSNVLSPSNIDTMTKAMKMLDDWIKVTEAKISSIISNNGEEGYLGQAMSNLVDKLIELPDRVNEIFDLMEYRLTHLTGLGESFEEFRNEKKKSAMSEVDKDKAAFGKLSSRDQQILSSGTITTKNSRGSNTRRASVADTENAIENYKTQIEAKQKQLESVEKARKEAEERARENEKNPNKDTSQAKYKEDNLVEQSKGQFAQSKDLMLHPEVAAGLGKALFLLKDIKDGIAAMG